MKIQQNKIHKCLIIPGIIVVISLKLYPSIIIKKLIRKWKTQMNKSQKKLKSENNLYKIVNTLYMQNVYFFENLCFTVNYYSFEFSNNLNIFILYKIT